MGNRGSKPGEYRGGRQKGTPNKTTVELALRARKYTDEALGVYLETIRATKFEVEPVNEGAKLKAVKVYRYANEARQRAADALLNRAWGLPSQDFMLRGPGEDGGHKVEYTFPQLQGMALGDLAKLYRAAVAPGKD